MIWRQYCSIVSEIRTTPYLNNSIPEQWPSSFPSWTPVGARRRRTSRTARTSGPRFRSRRRSAEDRRGSLSGLCWRRKRRRAWEGWNRRGIRWGGRPNPCFHLQLLEKWVNEEKNHSMATLVKKSYPIQRRAGPETLRPSDVPTFWPSCGWVFPTRRSSATEAWRLWAFSWSNLVPELI